MEYLNDGKMRVRSNLIRGILISMMLLVINSSCGQADIDARREQYRDILGYWQEYIIHENWKEKTAIRKIALKSDGKLTQSITYEMATQCRIWLNDDEISYQDGHLEFWGGEFKGDMIGDKNSIPLVYKQMANPFLSLISHPSAVVAHVFRQTLRPVPLLLH